MDFWERSKKIHQELLEKAEEMNMTLDEYIDYIEECFAPEYSDEETYGGLLVF